MDLSEKESVPEEINGVKKCCADCKTTKTPLWRSGPAGPKTLCNACGIRYRKKRGRGEDVDLEKEPVEKKREKLGYSSSSTSMKTGSVKGGNFGEDLRARLMALGKEVVILQRQRSPMKRQRSNVDVKKMGEVEQAAILLMAMSCGSVFA